MSDSNPRRRALELLGELRTIALDADDVALARRVHGWEGELLADEAKAGDRAEVIDLVERTKRR